jgi:ATP-binding cassette subfamily F protein 3
MLQIEDLTIALGTEEIISSVSWHIRPDERIGLVGRNGSGKTTLLRLLAGEIEAAAGTLRRRSDVHVGYLPQQAVSGSERLVDEEVRTQMWRINELKAELDRAQADADAGVDGAVERLAEATEAFRDGGGFSVDERVGEVLHGLGFRDADRFRSCASFSGGWQMRIALARLLLSEPNLLLLDEPTNHLDLAARTWLSNFLSRWKRAFVVVSHDRHLLDHAVSRIVEVRNHKLHFFAGNFTVWMKERERRIAVEAAAYESQQAEIARLEGFIERFGAKATKASQAQSRAKKLESMDRLDAPEREEGAPKLILPEAPGCSQVAVELRSADIGWGAEPLLRGVNLEIERGMRLAVVGPNGCGKSTLIKAITGTLPLLRGKRLLGHEVRIGVFDQDLAAALPPDGNALEMVSALVPTWPTSKVRGALGALGLRGDLALRNFSQLSGGQKARAALAAFCVRPYNVLVLDEPTNHLDVVTVQVLAEALSEFEGAILLVTHDRALAERLATHVAHIAGGVVDVRPGNDIVAPTTMNATPAPTAAAPDTHEYAARKANQREADRRKRRIEAISKEIEAAEAKMARLDDEMAEVASDFSRVRDIEAQWKRLEQSVAALYAEWETLDSA